MFGRIKLHPFIKANPPHVDCIPVTQKMLGSYEGRLPGALLELWRKHGLGRYGSRQIWLIDPDAWQAVLDRWIVSPANATMRIPIALTPFGTLLFYRKLTATEEDIATLNPITRSTRVLSWDLADCFNSVLSKPAQVDELIHPEMLDTAQREAGPLTAGEAYYVDPMLLTMQMLKIEKTDALSLHRRLRAQVDRDQAPPAPPPESIAAALPPQYRAAFKDIRRDDNHPCGLYLSTYSDWRRLIALEADGGYQLLFWRNDHKTGEASAVRHYSGRYRALKTGKGDLLVRLDLVLNAESLGSDDNDDALYLMRSSGGKSLLLQACALEDIATAIGGRGTMGRSEHYFQAVQLGEPFADIPSDGTYAPPFEDLPAALQTLVHREPLRATITEVGTDDDPEDSTVMAWVNLGTQGGLRMNMPLMSPRGSPRDLYGWVWRMDPKRCGVGLRVERDASGAIVNGPQIGDVLVTRAD